MNNIKIILKDHYDIDKINVSPQQGGWAALAYKVAHNKHSYFLKVYEKSRASTSKWTALIDAYVPIMVWLIHNSGLNGKIPVPLLTKNGDYKCEDDNGIYLLYEYIAGETIGKQSLTAEQVCRLSEIITELHLYGEDIPMETDAVKEDFDIPFLQPLKNTIDKNDNLIPEDLKIILNPRMDQINRLIENVNKLSVYLKNSHLKMALCHTDIHNWNLMLSGQQLVLIDWEGLRLAPVEADMMFLVDKPYFNQFFSIYRKFHKNYEINTDALQYYQHKRKLEDIWEFMEQLIFDKLDIVERAATVNSLMKELKSLN